MLVDEISQFEHQIASLSGRQKLPGVSRQSIARGLDSGIDILLAGSMDRSNLGLVPGLLECIIKRR